MEAKAIAKTVRIAPRKARLVADLVRGKSVVDAIMILANTNKAASPLIDKTIKSAAANAVNHHFMDEYSLENDAIRKDEIGIHMEFNL
jgi:large subunit ribosomal protein L22